MGSQCCKCSKGKNQERSRATSINIRFHGSQEKPTIRYKFGSYKSIKQYKSKPPRRRYTGYHPRIADILDNHYRPTDNVHRLSRHTRPMSSNVNLDEPQEGDPPLFTRKLTDLAVKIGTRTRFLVEIRSASCPKVTWQRNQEALPSEPRLSFVHEGNFYCIDVSPIAIEDEGHWTCTAENVNGTSLCTAYLTVIIPKAYKKPHFIEELRAILTESGNVSLECKVLGVPTPLLKWFKDEKEMKAGDIFALTAHTDDPTSLGIYRCEAVNCMGATSSSSKVHVIGSDDINKPIGPIQSSGPLPIFKKSLKSESCKIGDNLMLSCQIQVPPWPIDVAWYNEQGRIESNDKYHIMADGLGVYSIQINGLEAMDKGEWKCVATSMDNAKQFSTCTVVMLIPRNYRIPRFMEDLRAILTDEGLVSFECKVVGFPTPVLKWFKDGQELKPGDVYQLTGTNSLGSYCCVAKNCMGEAKSIAELTIEDIDRQLDEAERLQLRKELTPVPKFLVGLKCCEAIINENFTLSVRLDVTLAPEPSISWYRDDELIIEDTKYKLSKATVGNFNLEISNLEIIDQAQWKCLAENDFGHSVTSCFLKLVIPRHFKKPKYLENLRAVLSEDGTVNLECKVIGVPQPVLKWYKDGVELKPGDIHRIISGENGTCCLGTYTCEAKNCMGTASSSASLLGFENDAKQNKIEEPQQLSTSPKNISLSTIHEERTSQLYDTPQTEYSMSQDDHGEVSFSLDGREISVSLYETPDLTQEDAIKIIEMYADQLSEHITADDVIELPPMRFTKETSTSGNLLMEAVVIDVSPDYFVPNETFDDLRTEMDVEDVSIMDDPSQSNMSSYSSAMVQTPSRPVRKRQRSEESGSSKSDQSEKSQRKSIRTLSEDYHSAKEPSSMGGQYSLAKEDVIIDGSHDLGVLPDFPEEEHLKNNVATSNIDGLLHQGSLFQNPYATEHDEKTHNVPDDAAVGLRLEQQVNVRDSRRIFIAMSELEKALQTSLKTPEEGGNLVGINIAEKLDVIHQSLQAFISTVPLDESYGIENYIDEFVVSILTEPLERLTQVSQLFYTSPITDDLLNHFEEVTMDFKLKLETLVVALETYEREALETGITEIHRQLAGHLYCVMNDISKTLLEVMLSYGIAKCDTVDASRNPEDEQDLLDTKQGGSELKDQLSLVLSGIHFQLSSVLENASSVRYDTISQTKGANQEADADSSATALINDIENLRQSIGDITITLATSVAPTTVTSTDNDFVLKEFETLKICLRHLEENLIAREYNQGEAGILKEMISPIRNLREVIVTLEHADHSELEIIQLLETLERHAALALLSSSNETLIEEAETAAGIAGPVTLPEGEAGNRLDMKDIGLEQMVHTARPINSTRGDQLDMWALTTVAPLDRLSSAALSLGNSTDDEVHKLLSKPLHSLIKQIELMKSQINGSPGSAVHNDVETMIEGFLWPVNQLRNAMESTVQLIQGTSVEPAARQSLQVLVQSVADFCKRLTILQEEVLVETPMRSLEDQKTDASLIETITAVMKPLAEIEDAITIALNSRWKPGNDDDNSMPVSKGSLMIAGSEEPRLNELLKNDLADVPPTIATTHVQDSLQSDLASKQSILHSATPSKTDCLQNVSGVRHVEPSGSSAEDGKESMTDEKLGKEPSLDDQSPPFPIADKHASVEDKEPQVSLEKILGFINDELDRQSALEYASTNFIEVVQGKVHATMSRSSTAYSPATLEEMVRDTTLEELRLSKLDGIAMGDSDDHPMIMSATERADGSIAPLQHKELSEGQAVHNEPHDEHECPNEQEKGTTADHKIQDVDYPIQQEVIDQQLASPGTPEASQIPNDANDVKDHLLVSANAIQITDLNPEHVREDSLMEPVIIKAASIGVGTTADIIEDELNRQDALVYSSPAFTAAVEEQVSSILSEYSNINQQAILAELIRDVTVKELQRIKADNITVSHQMSDLATPLFDQKTDGDTKGLLHDKELREENQARDEPLDESVCFNQEDQIHQSMKRNREVAEGKESQADNQAHTIHEEIVGKTLPVHEVINGFQSSKESTMSVFTSSVKEDAALSPDDIKTTPLSLGKSPHGEDLLHTEVPGDTTMDANYISNIVDDELNRQGALGHVPTNFTKIIEEKIGNTLSKDFHHHQPSILEEKIRDIVLEELQVLKMGNEGINTSNQSKMMFDQKGYKVADPTQNEESREKDQLDMESSDAHKSMDEAELQKKRHAESSEDMKGAEQDEELRVDVHTLEKGATTVAIGRSEVAEEFQTPNDPMMPCTLDNGRELPLVSLDMIQKTGLNLGESMQARSISNIIEDVLLCQGMLDYASVDLIKSIEEKVSIGLTTNARIEEQWILEEMIRDIVVENLHLVRLDANLSAIPSPSVEDNDSLMKHARHAEELEEMAADAHVEIMSVDTPSHVVALEARAVSDADRTDEPYDVCEKVDDSLLASKLTVDGSSNDILEQSTAANQLMMLKKSQSVDNDNKARTPIHKEPKLDIGSIPRIIQDELDRQGALQYASNSFIKLIEEKVNATISIDANIKQQSILEELVRDITVEELQLIKSSGTNVSSAPIDDHLSEESRLHSSKEVDGTLQHADQPEHHRIAQDPCMEVMCTSKEDEGFPPSVGGTSLGQTAMIGAPDTLAPVGGLTRCLASVSELDHPSIMDEAIVQPTTNAVDERSAAIDDLQTSTLENLKIVENADSDKQQKVTEKTWEISRATISPIIEDELDRQGALQYASDDLIRLIEGRVNAALSMGSNTGQQLVLEEIVRDITVEQLQPIRVSGTTVINDANANQIIVETKLPEVISNPPSSLNVGEDLHHDSRSPQESQQELMEASSTSRADEAAPFASGGKPLGQSEMMEHSAELTRIDEVVDSVKSIPGVLESSALVKESLGDSFTTTQDQVVTSMHDLRIPKSTNSGRPDNDSLQGNAPQVFLEKIPLIIKDEFDRQAALHYASDNIIRLLEEKVCIALARAPSIDDQSILEEIVRDMTVEELQSIKSSGTVVSDSSNKQAVVESKLNSAVTNIEAIPLDVIETLLASELDPHQIVADESMQAMAATKEHNSLQSSGNQGLLEQSERIQHSGEPGCSQTLAHSAPNRPHMLNESSMLDESIGNIPTNPLEEGLGSSNAVQSAALETVEHMDNDSLEETKTCKYSQVLLSSTRQIINDELERQRATHYASVDFIQQTEAKVYDALAKVSDSDLPATLEEIIRDITVEQLQYIASSENICRSDVLDSEAMVTSIGNSDISVANQVSAGDIGEKLSAVYGPEPEVGVDKLMGEGEAELVTALPSIGECQVCEQFDVVGSSEKIDSDESIHHTSNLPESLAVSSILNNPIIDESLTEVLQRVLISPDAIQTTALDDLHFADTTNVRETQFADDSQMSLEGLARIVEDELDRQRCLEYSSIDFIRIVEAKVYDTLSKFTDVRQQSILEEMVRDITVEELQSLKSHEHVAQYEIQNKHSAGRSDKSVEVTREEIIGEASSITPDNVGNYEAIRELIKTELSNTMSKCIAQGNLADIIKVAVQRSGRFISVENEEQAAISNIEAFIQRECMKGQPSSPASEPRKAAKVLNNSPGTATEDNSRVFEDSILQAEVKQLSAAILDGIFGTLIDEQSVLDSTKDSVKQIMRCNEDFKDTEISEEKIREMISTQLQIHQDQRLQHDTSVFDVSELENALAKLVHNKALEQTSTSRVPTTMVYTASTSQDAVPVQTGKEINPMESESTERIAQRSCQEATPPAQQEQTQPAAQQRIEDEVTSIMNIAPSGGPNEVRQTAVIESVMDTSENIVEPLVVPKSASTSAGTIETEGNANILAPTQPSIMQSPISSLHSAPEECAHNLVIQEPSETTANCNNVDVLTTLKVEANKDLDKSDIMILRHPSVGEIFTQTPEDVSIMHPEIRTTQYAESIHHDELSNISTMKSAIDLLVEDEAAPLVVPNVQGISAEAVEQEGHMAPLKSNKQSTILQRPICATESTPQESAQHLAIAELPEERPMLVDDQSSTMLESEYMKTNVMILRRPSAVQIETQWETPKEMVQSESLDEPTTVTTKEDILQSAASNQSTILQRPICATESTPQESAQHLEIAELPEERPMVIDDQSSTKLESEYTKSNVMILRRPSTVQIETQWETPKGTIQSETLDKATTATIDEDILQSASNNQSTILQRPIYATESTPQESAQYLAIAEFSEESPKVVDDQSATMLDSEFTKTNVMILRRPSTLQVETQWETPKDTVQSETVDKPTTGTIKEDILQSASHQKHTILKYPKVHDESVDNEDTAAIIQSKPLVHNIEVVSVDNLLNASEHKVDLQILYPEIESGLDPGRPVREKSDQQHEGTERPNGNGQSCVSMGEQEVLAEAPPTCRDESLQGDSTSPTNSEPRNSENNKLAELHTKKLKVDNKKGVDTGSIEHQEAEETSKRRDKGKKDRSGKPEKHEKSRKVSQPQNRSHTAEAGENHERLEENQSRYDTQLETNKNESQQVQGHQQELCRELQISVTNGDHEKTSGNQNNESDEPRIDRTDRRRAAQERTRTRIEYPDSEVKRSGLSDKSSGKRYSENEPKKQYRSDMESSTTAPGDTNMSDLKAAPRVRPRRDPGMTEHAPSISIDCDDTLNDQSRYSDLSTTTSHKYQRSDISSASAERDYLPGPRHKGKKPIFCMKLIDRTAAATSRIKLTCSVLGDPDPCVSWLHNGRELSQPSNRYCMTNDNGVVSLEIYSVKPMDSGEYACTAKNIHGEASTESKLKVYAGYESTPSLPIFTRPIKDTFRLHDDTLTLECRVRAQPSPTVTWLKDGRCLEMNDRYRQSDLAEGICRLQIYNPSEYDNGMYTCRAENKSGFSECTSRFIHHDNTVDKHSAASSISTSRKRHALASEMHSIMDHDIHSFILPVPSESEHSMYSTYRPDSACSQYDYSTRFDGSHVYLKENGKPAIFISRPVDKLINVCGGEDVSVSFRVGGVPKPKVILMKGLVDITNGSRAYKESHDDYVRITFKRIELSDEGTYCILIKNRYGYDRCFFTIRVKQRARSLTPARSTERSCENVKDYLSHSYEPAQSKFKALPGPISSEPRVVDGGKTWLALSWGKAEQRGPAPVIAYRVDAWLLGGDGGARWIEVGVTSINSFDAFNLCSGEEYKFRITPRNRYGWGESVTMTNSVTVKELIKFPEFSTILPGQLKALQGTTVNLDCEISNKSMTYIRWYKDNAELDVTLDPRFSINNVDSKCSLSITDIRESDSGRYVCDATNAAGRVSTFARLQVVTDPKIADADLKLRSMRAIDSGGEERPPEFTMRLRDRRVQATYPVRLTCQVDGNPEPEVTWYKDEEQINLAVENMTISKDEAHFHTLEINRSKIDNTGIYMVRAENAYGSLSCRCHLVVDEGIRAYIAPEFSRLLDAAYTVGQNDELRMTAQVEAYPAVGITWYRDGKRLRPDRNTVMSLNHNGTIELTLAHVSCKNAGLYCCIATNEVGRAESKTKVQVLTKNDDTECHSQSSTEVGQSSNVPYSKEPVFITKPLSTEAFEGDNIIIVCQVIGDPKPDVIWLRDFLRPDYYKDAPHFRPVGLGPQYRLEIPYAKLDFTGTYSVIAKNCFGEAKAVISLQIYAKDPEKQKKKQTVKHSEVQTLPIIKSPLKNIRCCDGDAVTFICQSYATPPPSIRWEKGGKLVPLQGDVSSDFEGETARLHIQHVYPEDEGEYVCVAYNDLGSAYTSACLIVDVPEGKEISLNRRLKKPISLLSPNTTPISTPRSTPIRSLSPTCVRRELKPKSGQRARMPASPKFYAVPHNRVAEEGETVTFQCAVTGHPVPWSNWDKDGVTVTSTARISITEKDDLRILEIIQVTYDDAGLYRITLENDIGRVEATARLEIIRGKHESVSRGITQGASREMRATSDRPHHHTSLSSDSQFSSSTLVDKDGGRNTLSPTPLHPYRRGHTSYEEVQRDVIDYDGFEKEQAPVISATPADVIALHGDTVVLLATYSGHPEPTVRWFHEGQNTLPLHDMEISCVEGLTWLTLNKMTYEQAGRYVICIENAIGRDSKFVNVTVEGSSNATIPENFTEVRRTGKVGEEDFENSQCDPQITITDNRMDSSIKNYERNAEGPEDLVKNEPSLMDLLPKTIFEERYDILEEVGKGRYGCVRKIIDKSSSTHLAAKFVRTIKAKDRQQVLKEIQIMNEMKHPKMLHLITAFEGSKEIIMVTEYISGGELFERVVADDFTLTEKDSVLFVTQICEGVAYMHNKHIVHMDLKPENIMCQTRTCHRIKLIDFGLAQTLSPNTPVRVLFGTPEFISPEIISFEPIGTESDMWSIGVICYVLLTGLSPFMGDTDAETFVNITRADYDFEDEAFDAISKEAMDFISTLLIKKKELRLSAQDCLAHPWLAQCDDQMSRVVLSTDKLKNFIVRRKWQKTGNAIRALGRMANLSAQSRRNASMESEDIEEIPSEDPQKNNQFVEPEIVELTPVELLIGDSPELTSHYSEVYCSPEVLSDEESLTLNEAHLDDFCEASDSTDCVAKEGQRDRESLELFDDEEARDVANGNSKMESYEDPDIAGLIIDSQAKISLVLDEDKHHQSFYDRFSNTQIYQPIVGAINDDFPKEEVLELCGRGGENWSRKQTPETKTIERVSRNTFANRDTGSLSKGSNDFRCETNRLRLDEEDEKGENPRITLGTSSSLRYVRTGNVSRTAKLFEPEDVSSTLQQPSSLPSRVNLPPAGARLQNERIRKAFEFWNK